MMRLPHELLVRRLLFLSFCHICRVAHRLFSFLFFSFLFSARSQPSYMPRPTLLYHASPFIHTTDVCKSFGFYFSGTHGHISTLPTGWCFFTWIFFPFHAHGVLLPISVEKGRDVWTLAMLFQHYIMSFMIFS